MLDRSAVTLLALVAAGCGRERDQIAASPGLGVTDDAGDQNAASGVHRWQTRTLVQETPAGGNLALLVDGDGVAHVAFSVRPGVQSVLRHAWIRAEDSEGQSERVGSGGILKGWVPGGGELRLIYGDDHYRSTAWDAVRGIDGVWAVEVHNLSPNGVATTALWRGQRLRMARLTALPVEDGWIHGVEYDGEPIPEAHQLLTPTQVDAELDLAVDSAGRVHIVYAAPVDDTSSLGPPWDRGAVETLRYVSFKEGSWSDFYTLTPEPGFHTGVSLALGPADDVHVTYTRSTPSNGAPSVQHVSRPHQGAWEHEAVPFEYMETASESLVVDAMGGVHLAYWTIDAEGRSMGAAYATKREGTWETEPLQAGCGGRYATLTAGVDGALYMAHLACDGAIAISTRSTQAVGED